MKQTILTILISIFLNISCPVSKKPQTDTNINISTATPITGITNQNSNEETKISPAADTLSIALTALRKGKQKSAEATETFIEGEGIRLNISMVEKGYLYVLYKGSSGTAQVLFPNKDYFNGKNEIEPNKTVVIPNKGWFFFDKKAGTETVFVVYSKIQDSKTLSGDVKENLTLLEKLQSENNSNVFTTDEGNLVRVIKLKHQ